MNAKVLGWVAGLGAFLVLVLAPACQAQLPLNATPWGKYVSPGPVPEGMGAVTVCVDGSPSVHFYKDEGFLSADEAGELWAHESVHVRQLTADSSVDCETAFARLTGDVATLTAAEAEATCAQATWLSGQNRDGMAMLDRWIVRFTEYLNSSHDPAWETTTTAVRRTLQSNCPLFNTLYESGH